jgi:hypothetical protein
MDSPKPDRHRNAEMSKKPVTHISKYLAARSNEFGLASYEIIPAVNALNPLR